MLKELVPKIRSSTAVIIGEGNVPALREVLMKIPPQTPPFYEFQIREQLTTYLLFAGELEKALEESTLLVRYSEQQKLDPELLCRALTKRAVTNFRLAERANCVAHHNEESCIFPLSPKAVHKDKVGATAAAKDLVSVLTLKPDHLQAKWLLNIAHMALGTYPDGVPKAHLIPPSSFASEYDIGRFTNVAASAGLNTFNLAGGAAMDDFDGDGLLDVLTSSSLLDQPLCLKRNRGDGTFEDISERSGILGQVGGLNLIHADYDNDGRLDVLVLRGAWSREWGEVPNSLLKQMPDGTFHDVTLEAGIEVAAPTQAAAFADIDLDGFLDLYVGYEGETTSTGPRYPCRMYRNRGDGTFEDKGRGTNLENWAYCKGVSFGDYDNDGDPDLYVSNLDRVNRLYRNDGGWKFTDVALDLGVQAPVTSFATWFFDYNNDGWLDIWVNQYGPNRLDPVAAYYINHGSGLDVGRLYENDRKGGFVDVTKTRDLDRPYFAMGCSFGDLDNDGYQDAYLATGDPDLSSLWPNVMYRNDRGERFQDVTQSGGFGLLQKGHSVAFGDIDNDGDQDVFVEMGGAAKDDGFWNALFLNPGHGHHWLTVHLEGVQTNRSAFGARIRVRVADALGQRDVYACVGSRSSFGGNSLQEELGLGDAESIIDLEITWPVSKTTQHFTEVPMDSFLEIREGDAAFRVVDRQPVPARN